MDDVSPPSDAGSYFPPPPYPGHVAPPPGGYGTPPPGYGTPPPGSEPPHPRRRLPRVGLAIAGGAFALLGAGFLLGRAATSTPSNAAVGATTDLASAGLATANDPSPAAAPAAPGCNKVAKHGVAGTLKSVNGNTLTVTPARGGNDVKVTTTGSTKITKVENGSLKDITNGALVTVHGTTSNSVISARQVGILPAGTNLKNPPEQRDDALEQHGFAFGKVTSVSNGGFVIQRSDNSTVNVTTSSSTQVVKTVTASVGDLTTGQPIAVMGTTNPDGSVTADNIVQAPEGLNFKGLGRGFGPRQRFGRFGRFGNGIPAPNAPASSGPANPTA